MAWTDDPLVQHSTKIKKVHIEELRNALNDERTRRGLSTLTWTDDPLTEHSTKIKAIHIEELRDGVDDTASVSNNSTYDSDIDGTKNNTINSGRHTGYDNNVESGYNATYNCVTEKTSI